MTTVLAIDTATNACSAAVWEDGSIIASRYEEMIRGQAERLMPMVAEIADEVGRSIKNVNLVAVTIGPGAFTGVRIGLAAARGFALSAKVSCLGLTTLEVIAASIVPARSMVLVALSSKREDVYFQIFDCDGAQCNEATTAQPEQVSVIAAQYAINGKDFILAGDGALAVSEHLCEVGIHSEILPIRYPHAAVVAKLAASRLLSGGPISRPKPLYLRAPDATIPLLGGRLRP